MIKIHNKSSIDDKGTVNAACPLCGGTLPKKVFGGETALYLNSIQVKTIHNKYFAVCSECKQSYELAKSPDDAKPFIDIGKGKIV